MGSNKIQAISQLEEPIKQICAFKAATYVNFSGHSLDSQLLFHQFREMIGLPPNLPPCLAFQYEEASTEEFYSTILIVIDISINGIQRSFGNSICSSQSKYGHHLCFYCRPQSSLQKLFQDLNLGVHVECNCPQPQNVEALGLSMDNYEARSTCLCGAQTCCQCLKEVGSMHSAGRASVHSSNLESQIISSDTDGGGSSSVILPSNSGLPMDVANGVQENENHLIKFRRNMARLLLFMLKGLLIRCRISSRNADFNNKDSNLMIASIGGYIQVAAFEGIRSVLHAMLKL
nr:hypothetical protein CFP56_33367 [Quercus suber]